MEQSLEKYAAPRSSLARLSSLKSACHLLAMCVGSAAQKADAALRVAARFERYVRDGGAP